MEDYKAVLIEIIEEASTLPIEELEIVGNSTVLVKKGRSEEFRYNAFLYYQYINSVIVGNVEVNYVQEVYDLLKTELSHKKYDEHLDNDKYLSNVPKRAEMFRKLKQNLTFLENDKSKYEAKKASASSVKRASLEKTILEIDANIIKIKKQAEELKTKINSDFYKILQSYMQSLKNRALNNLNNQVDYTLDNSRVLVDDKELYDNCWLLLDTLKKAPIKGAIVCLNGLVCVSPDQFDNVIDLLEKIDLFKNFDFENLTTIDFDYKDEEHKNIYAFVTHKDEERKKIYVFATHSDVNAQLLENVENNLQILIKDAKNSNEPKALNGIVLEKDYALYILLKEQFDILQEAKTSNDIVTLGNLTLPKHKVNRYNEVTAKIEELFNIRKFEKNKAMVIADILKKINILVNKAKKSDKPKIDNDFILKEDEQEYNLLIQLYKFVKALEVSSDCIEINGLIVPTDKVDEYCKILDELDKLKINDQSNENKIKYGPKKKVKKVGVNNLPSRELIISGLASMIITYDILNLAPAIVYSNFCLMAKDSNLQSFLGKINNILVRTLNIPMEALNFNFTADKVGSSFIPVILYLSSIIAIVNINNKAIKVPDNPLIYQNKLKFMERIKMATNDMLANCKKISNIEVPSLQEALNALRNGGSRKK